MGVEDAKKIIKKYIMVPVFMLYIKEQMSNHNIIVAILKSLIDFANHKLKPSCFDLLLMYFKYFQGVIQYTVDALLNIR